MGYEEEIDLSSSKLRFNYLDKLNFARSLVIDLLSPEEDLKIEMKLLSAELNKIIKMLSKDAVKNLDAAYKAIEKDDEFLEFVYFASEEEIFLKLKDKFALEPGYSWQLFDKIYGRLAQISKQIDNLSEITCDDISEIQKSLMQIAIIFNNNLCGDLAQNKYLIRHLNATYHCLRGELNESLYLKGNLETEWDALDKARTEYERALEFDENLIKAREKLAELESTII